MKNNRLTVGLVLLAGLCLVCLFGCDENGKDTACDGGVSEDHGALHVRWVQPSDVIRTELRLMEGVDENSATVEEDIIPSSEDNVNERTFTCLKPGDYMVAFTSVCDGMGYFDPCCEDPPEDQESHVCYDGHATIFVQAGRTETIHLIINQPAIALPPECNTVPEIEALTVAGRTVSLVEPDGGKLENVDIPVGENPLTFVVTASDCHNDALTIVWAVKDGPLQDDADAGTFTNDENTGATVGWQHPGAGEYYATVVTTDGRGGAAVFSFTVTVTS